MIFPPSLTLKKQRYVFHENGYYNDRMSNDHGQTPGKRVKIVRARNATNPDVGTGCYRAWNKFYSLLILNENNRNMAPLPSRG